MRLSRKKLLTMALIAGLLGVIYYMHSEYSLKGYTAEQLSANPALLDGATLQDGEYSGLTLTGRSFTGTVFKKLVLKNLRIRNCTFKNVLFENVDILPSEITNVVFENCQFVNARFDDAVFRNVLLKGGVMTYKGTYEYYYTQTYFHNSTFNKVVLDDVRISYADFESITGTVFFKNMRQISLPREDFWMEMASMSE